MHIVPEHGLDGAPYRIGRLPAGRQARSLAALFIFQIVKYL